MLITTKDFPALASVTRKASFKSLVCDVPAVSILETSHEYYNYNTVTEISLIAVTISTLDRMARAVQFR